MAGIQAQRTNTLDRFLDELPELSSGYFSFPVDDFFDNYVEELGQRGAQNGSTESASRPEVGEYPATYDALGAQSAQARPQLSSAMSLDLNLGADQLDPIVSLPDNPTAFADGSDAMLGMPAIAGQPKQDIKQNHSEGSGSGVWMDAPAQADTRPKRPAAKPDYALDDSDEAEQNRPKGARGKTKRNAKQQVQNKQAQQRYRERRKQRFVEMEHTIDGLNAKVQQMQAVQSQNTMLQAKRSELEAMLREKEQELERLRAQLESGGGTGGGGGGGVVEERSLEQRRRAEEANLRECQAQVAAHVRVLREFIEEHGLRAVKPSGEGVDAGVLAQLAELVGRGCSTCQSAMRAEGVKVLRLMSRDVRHLSRIACLRECNKWTHILQTLQLTEQQEEQLLLMRKNHLRNLRSVYEARQQLNIQAMALMLPPAERNAEGPKDLEGKIACMSLRGYSISALQSADLDEILNSIKENLRLEQKHVMEMNFVTMHRLLSPLQAALFILEVQPEYCDSLMLANVLASRLEERAKHGERGAEAMELIKVDSISSQAGGEQRQSPASSENKSDTCPLLARELEANEAHKA